MKRPERTIVENAYKENPRRKAHEIASEAGLIDTMGYDKAVSYVKNVKKSMKEKGQIVAGAYAPDEERLQDVITLLNLRQGKMNRRAAYTILLMNCYYRLKSEDDAVHMRAIDDTYEINASLEDPLEMSTAIRICENALEQYMRTRDSAQVEAAIKKGYPGAGLNYTDESFIDRLEVTPEEMKHLISIKRG